MLAYWPAATGPTAVLRLRFLHDGRDFSSAHVRNAQRGPRVLSALSLLRKMGDYSLHLDPPLGGVFQAEDFRVRYHLQAADARVEDLGAGRYRLVSGDWCGIIHTTPGRFGSRPVTWQTGGATGEAWVDGIGYAGPRQGFDFEQVDGVAIAGGLELRRTGDPVASERLQLTEHDGQYWVAWGELQVTAPLATEDYAWAPDTPGEKQEVKR